MEEQTKDLSDYLGAIKRRRRSVTVIASVIFLLGATIALLLPSTYRSAATILIEEQEIPPELVQSTVTSYASQRIQVISQRVMTRSNLMEIINKYGLYEDERKRRTTEEIIFQMREDIDLDMLNAEVVDPRTGRPTAATIAFTVSFQGEQPHLVQKVASELTTLYLQENLKTRASKAQETYSFLKDESERLNNTIAQLESRLASFKEEHMYTLPELKDLNSKLLERTESEIEVAKGDIRTLQDRKIFLEGQLGLLDPHGDDIATSPSARLKALRTQYVALLAKYSESHPDVLRLKREMDGLRRETGEVDSADAILDEIEALRVELAGARERYSDEHPDVARLKNTIAALEKDLEQAQSATPTSPRSEPDSPAYVQVRSQIQAADNEISGLRRKIGELEAKRSQYEQRLIETPQVEREYRQLARDLQTASTKYQEIKAKQMQAKVAQQLEAESKGERFTLIEPPAVPEEPVSPNRPAILFLSLVLALGGGLGFAAVGESLDSSIRGMKGVTQTLQVAPLAVIPYLESDREISRRRRRGWSLVVGSLASVILVALLVHLFVTPLDVLWYKALRRASILTGIGSG
jgi:uncharacterized protein involved in exopolysaccharide biosynthesis